MDFGLDSLSKRIFSEMVEKLNLDCTELLDTLRGTLGFPVLAPFAFTILPPPFAFAIMSGPFAVLLHYTSSVPKLLEQRSSFLVLEDWDTYPRTCTQCVPWQGDTKGMLLQEGNASLAMQD